MSYELPYNMIKNSLRGSTINLIIYNLNILNNQIDPSVIYIIICEKSGIENLENVCESSLYETINYKLEITIEYDLLLKFLLKLILIINEILYCRTYSIIKLRVYNKPT